MKKSFWFALCVLCVSAVSTNGVQAQTDEQLATLAQVNEARRANGVPALAWSAQLAKAAQGHSDDMASKGFVDEVGSDGTTSRQRIDTAGYARWPSVRAWGESIYAGQTDFAEALGFFLNDEVQRRALLNPKFREIGIGIGKDSLRTYWTVTLGAQPNLLPVFINDDAPVTNNRQVAVQLTQEEAVPNGEGNAIGRVVEIRISDKPDFAGAAWQPWEALVPFTLDRRTGTKTVYVQMRDGAGRTTIGSDTIEYDPNSRGNVRSVGSGVAATQPAPAPTEIPTVLPLATEPPPPTATSIAINPVITLPPDTPTPEATIAAQPAAATPTLAPAAIVVIIQPTDTPAPSVESSPASESDQPLTTLIEPSPTPSTATDVRQFGAAQPALPGWLVPLYLVAQTAVIVLGLVALLRRK
jgi:hypothetical protein